MISRRRTLRMKTRYRKMRVMGMRPRPKARRQTRPRRLGCAFCLAMVWTSQMQSRMSRTATLVKLPTPCSAQRWLRDSTLVTYELHG